MAGPTPVSALIHAATMVVAGVFLGARLYPVFFNGFSIGHGDVNFMAVIGGVTIVIGAVLAFVQTDLKKVLAYSTISQLGYMVMGLGVGAWSAAVFHLFTHAFFKALLFLGAGSVSHSAGHSFDMRDMGGLRKPMPITFWTFLIGSLALAGIFPLAGFWSKDEILVNAGTNGYDAFLIVGLVGAFLTAAYMTRAVYLTFFGEYRGHEHPHESERTITGPLVVLGVLSAGAGLVNAAPLGVEKIKDWIEPTVAFPSISPAAFDYPKALLSVGIALAAIGIAASYWLRRDDRPILGGLTERNPLARAGYAFLVNKYYLDDLYEKVIVRGLQRGVARASYWVDQHVIDGAVNGLAHGAAGLARLTYDVVDQRLVDGAVNELAREADVAGVELRRVQSGRVQRYALLLFGGVGMLSLAIFLTNTI
jgi:NADH-quinone oxidoreductase subunit L